MIFLFAGPVKYIHFPFSLDTDTVHSVVDEMIEHLELAEHEVAFIADFIEYVIMRLLPGWKPSCNDPLGGVRHPEAGPPVLGNGNNLGCAISHDDGNSSPTLADAEDPDSLAYASTMVCGEDSGISGKKLPRNDISNMETNSLSSFDNSNQPSDIGSLTCSCSTLSVADEDQDAQLKQELDAIELKYQLWFEELSRMRVEALEATKRRWMKKKLAIQ